MYQRFPKTSLLLAIALLVAGCTGDPENPVASRSSAEPEPLTALWATDLQAMDKPLATRTGFAFPSFTKNKDFEVISLEARTGKVRWRSEASPSLVAGGQGLTVLVSPDKTRVIWTRPGESYAAGQVTVAAADAVTGEEAWKYGSGRLRLYSPLELCRDDKAICLFGQTRSGGAPSFVVLDVTTGRVLQTRAATEVEYLRSVSDDLREDGKNLVAVQENGQSLWSRPFSAVFGGEKVNPDFGWEIQRKDGRYVGSLGYVRPDEPVRKGGTRIMNLAGGLSATAGFDARTGRTLWAVPRASVQCGQLEFVIEHPMRCTYRGTVTFNDADKDPTSNDLAVTVQGFDPATGKAKWTWAAGAATGLVGFGKDVTRLGDTRYAVTTPQGTTILDADSGALPAPAGTQPEGWCTSDDGVTPRKDRRVGADVDRYATRGWFPCQAGGKALPAPPNAPAFALNVVDQVAAWLDQDTHVHGARVP